MTSRSVIPEWLGQRARSHPDHPAIVAGGETLSYSLLNDRVGRRTGQLYDCGVRAGDAVALLLANGTRFAELLHALTRLGAAAVPLHPRQTGPELSEMLRPVRPRLLLHDGTSASLVREIETRIPLATLDVGREPSARSSVCARVIDLDAVHTVIFTSGSTGVARPVALSAGNHLWSAVGSAFNLGVHADDRWLACLPFCHVGGLSILLRSVIYGTTAVIHDGFDADRVCQAIDEDRVTIVSLVATMLRRLLDVRRKRPFPPWIRCVLVGGGPVPRALLERAAALRVPVVQTYGLTEAASQVTTLSPQESPRKPGAAGRPLLPTEVRLDPLEAGSATGEILVRGPTVSPGLWGRPPRPADEWLRTGDLGRFDDEGFLYVVGRRDDMFVSGGENVHPVEIESALRDLPQVLEALVQPVPDPQWGQTAEARVVLRPGCRADAEDLRQSLGRRLAGFKLPGRIYLVDDLPRTATGKIRRRT